MESLKPVLEDLVEIKRSEIKNEVIYLPFKRLLERWMFSTMISAHISSGKIWILMARHVSKEFFIQTSSALSEKLFSADFSSNSFFRFLHDYYLKRHWRSTTLLFEAEILIFKSTFQHKSYLL